MDNILTRIKDDILIYADEPSDAAKYTDAWLYDQIGRTAANLHQQVASTSHMVFKASASLTASVTDQTRHRLPGNFLKLIRLDKLNTDGDVIGNLDQATDEGQLGFTIFGPYEIETPKMASGDVFTLYYQRKAIPELFYVATLDTITSTTIVFTTTNAVGNLSLVPNYYAGSYVQFTASDQVGQVGQIYRVTASSVSGTDFTLTVDPIIPETLPTTGTVQVLPEVPPEHWDTIAWAIVMKMKMSSTDKTAFQMSITAYKEARHWFLQFMIAMKGRYGDQFVEGPTWTGLDKVWDG